MEESIIINPETKYIAIEGPVGSGKTSLAKKLAEHLDGKLILEQPETNPFLENSGSKFVRRTKSCCTYRHKQQFCYKEACELWLV